MAGATGRSRSRAGPSSRSFRRTEKNSFIEFEPELPASYGSRISTRTTLSPCSQVFQIQVAGALQAAGHSGYDISPDGRQLVFYSPDRDGKLRLWLAPLDRSSPPRQIPNVEGEQPLFGPNGEIFFRKLEGTSAFLYSVREDGTGLRKVFESPVVVSSACTPDHKWLLLAMSRVGEVIFPVAAARRSSRISTPPGG